MQSLMRMIYPFQCLTCAEMVEEDFALCGSCWRDTSFIRGLTCRSCGVPLPGDEDGEVRCDDCMAVARPWSTGSAALMYHGTGRRLVMALKHGDRTELAKPAARWMADVLQNAKPGTAVVPIPLHWRRFLKRRYNQSALLAKELAKLTQLDYAPDALQRVKRTKPLDGRSRDERFKMLYAAIRPHPKKAAMLKDRPVLLVDDVMTSGATLAAATEACTTAGAIHVDVLVLARVAKDR